MTVFFHVAKNTARECLREPVFFVLLVTAVIFIGLFPSLSLFVFREQIKLVVDSSMATTMIFGLFAAVISAGGSITREMRNGTALLLLSKPVSRWVFVLAKVVGIIASLSIFVFICSCATLVSVNVAKDQFELDYIALYTYYGILAVSFIFAGARNYFLGKSFPSQTVLAICVVFLLYCIALQIFKPSTAPENSLGLKYLLPALAMLFFAVWTMASISIVLSTRMDILPNMILCSIIFLLGLVSDYYFAEKAAENFLYSVVYAAIPNWQLFWLADALANRKIIPIEYLFMGFLYVILYIGFASLLATLLFEGRDIVESV